MKRRTKIVIAIVIITILILGSIIAYLYMNREKVTQRKRYVDGEIFVQFDETVNKTQAIKTIEKFNLTILYYPDNHSISYKVEVPIGEEDYYIEELKKEHGVIRADRVRSAP